MMWRVVAACALAAAVYAATGDAPQSSSTGVFTNEGAALSYALTLPAGRAPYPAVVIGHGSGPARKDQCASLLDGFVRRGYAMLCFDKRGAGESTGTYEDVTIGNSERVFATLAADLAAGVAFLSSRPDIDSRRIGLAGGSQAGWIVPLAAARARPVPAFMILLSAPTVTVGEEIAFSRAAENTRLPIADAYARLDAFAGPHGFDPIPVLRSLDVRGLWLLGLADRSIPIRHTIHRLDALIKDGRPYRHVDFEAAGHSLDGADIWPAIDAFLAQR